MMIKKLQLSLILLIVFLSECIGVYGQQILPEFNVIDRNGIVIIGWNNPHPDLTQLIIQKSIDSSTGFRSIMSMPDPTSFSNGYVDKKPGANQYFYRIFYVQPGGRYTFTAAKKSKHVDSASSINIINAVNGNPSFKNQSVLNLSLSRDLNTGLKPLSKIDSTINENVFTPSPFLFTDKEGNLVIALPDVEKKKFSIHVFREDGTELFQIKNIKESQLLIDRSNFYHSGWFKFNLYEGTTLKEQNKFFIPPIGK